MGYKDSSSFQHNEPDRVGLLITNLGTPKAATASALRVYLKEFLSDPRVVEFPRLLWWIVLNCIILRIRPSRSAKAYQKVWTEEGSPLAVHTQAQAAALRKKMQDSWGDEIVVDWAMRYGQPSVASAIDNMIKKGVRKLLVLPLYPQYSASTTASTFDALAKDFTQRRWMPELRFVTQYNDNDAYIGALAKSVTNHWDKHGRADKLVFSFHGIPLRYLHNGDPYHCQCHKTSRLLANALGLNEEEYLTTFQSRFGREAWLQPYTDKTLESLPSKGIKSIQVMCPGFSADCLETIEEIDMENRDIFLEAGGENFQYIPALNAQDIHIDALATIAESHLAGWKMENSSAQTKRDSIYQSHKHNLQN